MFMIFLRLDSEPETMYQVQGIVRSNR